MDYLARLFNDQIASSSHVRFSIALTVSFDPRLNTLFSANKRKLERLAIASFEVWH